MIEFSWSYGDEVFQKSSNLCNTILIGLITSEIRTELIGLFLCKNFKKSTAVKLKNTTKATNRQLSI
uniref:Uncharacterized protein n=1 Tax=Strongyloides papillosus TaxID=174720 RepID=A0A0N5C410_STREA